MKACFDTSTLVAALLQQHPHHAVAFPRLRTVHEGSDQGHLTTHGLAELFATLTSLPLKPRLLPADVHRLIRQSVLNHFTLIPLGSREYQDAMDLTVAKNLASGAIYDALHLAGARSAGCTALWTLNLRHFQALAPGDPLVSPPRAICRGCSDADRPTPSNSKSLDGCAHGYAHAPGSGFQRSRPSTTNTVLPETPTP